MKEGGEEENYNFDVVVAAVSAFSTQCLILLKKDCSSQMV